MIKVKTSYLSTNRAPAGVFAIVGCFLHRACNKTVRAEKMTLESLIGEETVLTFLTVEWRSVVDHLRVDLEGL
jgi:hypothetical protein